MSVTNWTARVDWHQPTPPADEQLERVMAALEGYHPALGFEYPPDHPVIASAVVTLDAGSLLQAAASAVDLVEAAAGVEAKGIEVLTTEERDRQFDR